jgi:NADPH:quinone reductase-like Zn-dependent oxidoreductase
MLSEGAYVPSTDAPSALHVRAAIVDAPGAEPHIHHIELAARTSGTTLIEVIAAPLNPLDLLIASGNFHSARHGDPYVPGAECVGTVIESDTFAPGALVYAEPHASPTTPGAFAERVLVADADILPLPDGVDPVLAAAIGNSGVAAFMPLVDVARMTEGDTVLVLGATGAVGQLAIQIARLRGAGRVIGVARDAAALDRVLALGADAVIQLRAGEDAESLGARMREVSTSVDVILDALYGLPFEAALGMCAPRARVVNVGHSAGPNATIPAGVLRGKQLTVTGFAGLHTSLRDKLPALTWLWGTLASGEIEVAVTPVSLDELPEAWRAQANSPHSKYVVVPQALNAAANSKES